MTSRIQQQVKQIPSLSKRGSVLHHLFRMKCYQTFHRSPHNLDNMKMMLILHHISQGSFKIMSDASHEPYHRNPLSQRRIPGFHARFQLRDILLTGFYILDIRYEIVLVKAWKLLNTTRYSAIASFSLSLPFSYFSPSAICSEIKGQMEARKRFANGSRYTLLMIPG